HSHCGFRRSPGQTGKTQNPPESCRRFLTRTWAWNQRRIPSGAPRRHTERRRRRRAIVWPFRTGANSLRASVGRKPERRSQTASSDKWAPSRTQRNGEQPRRTLASHRSRRKASSSFVGSVPKIALLGLDYLGRPSDRVLAHYML